MNHNFNDMMEANASAKPGKNAAPKLDHMRLIPAKEGGHVVEHHMRDGNGNHMEPETHVFGESEGKELMAHLQEHGKIKMEHEPEEDEDSAAGAAS